MITVTILSELSCRENSACGYGTAIVVAFFWVALPLGALIGWIVGKVNGRKIAIEKR